MLSIAAVPDLPGSSGLLSSLFTFCPDFEDLCYLCKVSEATGRKR